VGLDFLLTVDLVSEDARVDAVLVLSIGIAV
jgi:hypothetical protein